MKRNRVMMLAQRLIRGDAEHVRVLGTQLLTRGWDVSVVANWRPESSKVERSTFEEVGLRTYSVDFPIVTRRMRVAVEAALAAHAFVKLLDSEQPDIVHTHWRSALPYCLTPHCPPVVFTKHLLGATDWASNAIYRIPRRVIAISSEVEGELVSRAHVPKDRVRLVVHGVDTRYLAAPNFDKRVLRQLLGLPEEGLVLVSVGRLSAQKDHQLTIAALHRLKATDLPLHLVIVGEGPTRAALVRQIEQLGLQEAVTLTGHAEPDPYLDAADIFVLSSIYEGFALAVVEGMMRGLPPIRTSTGGAMDQVEHGVNGLIFRPGDVAGLAEAVALLATNPTLRATMAEAARTRARARFTSELMAERTESVYRELLT